MAKGHIATIIACASYCLLTPYGSAVMGQEMDLDEYLAAENVLNDRSSAYVIEKVGADDPRRIPFGVKMRAFLRNIDTFQDSVAKSVSGQTLTVLKTMANNEETNSANDNEGADQVWTDICANIDNLDAETIARKIQSVSDAFMTNRETRYREAMKQVDRQDQQAVYTFIDENIARNARITDMDIVGLARELPKEFKLRTRRDCIQRKSELNSSGQRRKPIVITTDGN